VIFTNRDSAAAMTIGLAMSARHLEGDHESEHAK